MLLQRYILISDDMGSFRKEAQDNGTSIIEATFPSQAALKTQITDGKTFDVYIEEDGGTIEYGDAMSPPSGFISLPILMAAFKHNNLRTLGQLISEEGKDDGTISFPDYDQLNKLINTEFKGTANKYNSARVFINVLDKISVTQSLDERMDKTKSFRVKYKVDFYTDPLSFLKKEASKSSGEKKAEINFIHKPIPETSFADYVDYVNERQHYTGTSFESIANGLQANENGIAKVGDLEIIQAGLLSAPRESDESSSVNVGIFDITYSVFYVLFPILVIAILLIINYYVNLALRAIKSGDQTSATAVKAEVVDKMLPFKSDGKFHKLFFYLIFLLVPLIALLTTLIVKYEKFSILSIILYPLAITLVLLFTIRLNKQLLN
ncbi:hypothetical protein D4L85_33435 [Chryseolinea soli]|uniref:Uncharacterized protein n=2 Tax=Chryseolinea soli TaxID=2321403 RepID=A0A385SXU4_9BACT|nr:hypothetical protein D4L85_33435 [Chryseolinea soli]